MIGLNWLSDHVMGDTIVWHNGGTGGYRTFIGLAPSRHMAVVVMTNSAGEGADDIGMHLLNRRQFRSRRSRRRPSSGRRSQ